MNNLKAEQLKNNLYKLLNSCGLEVSTAYFILKDIFRDLEQEYKITIEKEYQAELLKIQQQEEEHANEQIDETVPTVDK